MSTVTRRSKLACERAGFDPLDHETCVGFTEDGERCKETIDLQRRRIAHLMIGHGAHLFSDSEELHEILREAADLLFCSQQHNDTESLTRGWLIHWQSHETTDRQIQTLIQQRVSERIPMDRTWQTRFENAIGRILRSDLPAAEKLARVTTIIGNDRRDNQALVASEATLSGRPVLMTSLSQPGPARLPRPNQSRILERHHSASASSTTSTSVSMSSANTPANLYMDCRSSSTVSAPPARAMSSTETTPIQRTQSASGMQMEGFGYTPGEGISRLVTNTERPQSAPSRRMSLSELGSVILRTLQSTSSPSATPDVTEGGENLVRPVSTGSTAFPASGQGSTSRSLFSRPSLSLRTTVSDAPTTVSPVSASASRTPASGTPWSVVPMSSISEQLAPVEEARDTTEQEQGNQRECDMCTKTYKITKKDQAWSCPGCKAWLHVPCFQEWNLQNLRMRRSTPCPYCRHIIHRPGNF